MFANVGQEGYFNKNHFTLYIYICTYVCGFVFYMIVILGLPYWIYKAITPAGDVPESGSVVVEPQQVETGQAGQVSRTLAVFICQKSNSQTN